jgi:Ca-activated chloride channel family protein
MYSERSKFPWGAVVVIGATLVFGCIIIAALVLPKVFQRDTITNPITGQATQEAPKGSVAIDIASSNTKEDWMNAVVEQFNAAGKKIPTGEGIFVRVTHVTSGGSQQAILDGKSQPTVWSPGDQSWIDGANQVWRDRTGRVLISEPCKPTVLAPIGFAMWRPMAEALGWPDKPIHWADLVELSANPDGWASLGHPEWGQFKFGHTHPGYSNTGMLMLTSIAYSMVGKTTGLTVNEVYSDKVMEAFRGLEQNTYHYGIQNRPLMQLLANRGPDYLHAVTSSEAEVLKTNKDFADILRFQLVFIFPADGTYWSEQPYCILDADWVTDEQRQAAQVFLDYLLAPEQQNIAVDYYLRPVDERIALRAPLSLESGTDPRVTRSNIVALASPSSDLSAAVIDVFKQTKKKSTVVLVLDTSGSMEGEKIKNAVSSSVNFIKRLDPNDQIFVLGFGSGGVVELGGGRAGDVAEDLSKTLSGLYASGGTPLYDSICQAISLVDKLQSEADAAGDRRLYGIVLLSDGDDTSSQRSENQMFGCLPSGEDVTGVKIFTIAYGEDANVDLMLRIANRTNGKEFQGDPESIENIYNSISAEQ